MDCCIGIKFKNSCESCECCDDSEDSDEYTPYETFEEIQQLENYKKSDKSLPFGFVSTTFTKSFSQLRQYLSGRKFT